MIIHRKIDLLLAGFLLFVSSICYAEENWCEPNENKMKTEMIYFDKILFGDWNANGVIGEREILLGSVARCKGRIEICMHMESGYDEIISNSDIYNTSLQGVGLSVSGGHISGNADNHCVVINATGGRLNFNDPVKVQLIKTNNITPGEIPAGRIASYWWRGIHQEEVAGGINIILSHPIKLIKKTCHIKANMTIPFGDVLMSQFSGPGSKISSATHNIDLNCNHNDNNISVRLEGEPYPSSEDGLLALLNAESESSATGFAVRLILNEKKLILNKNTKIALEEKATLALRAEYVQTRNKIKAGIANSRATLVFTYQ